MACFTTIPRLLAAIICIYALGSAFPTLTITPRDFPFFLSFSQPQNICGEHSFASVPLKNANAHSCTNLRSFFETHLGQYIVGDFDIVDDWMPIGAYEGCTLAVKATTKEDAGEMAKWFIGNGDAFQLVTETIEMAFHDGQGAAEGVIMCRWSRGGVGELYWRVWDSRED